MFPAQAPQPSPSTPLPAAPPPADVQVAVWEDWKHFPQSKLKIQRINEVGDREDLGTIPRDGQDEHILAHVRYRPGKYLIQPIDDFGRVLTQDPYVRLFPPDHPLIRSRAEGGHGGIPGTSPAAPVIVGIPADQVMAMMAKERAEMMALLAAERERLEAERKAIMDERDKISKERLQLAVANTSSALEVQNALIDRSQKRDDQAQLAILQVLTQARESDESRHRRDMEARAAEQKLIIEQMKTTIEMERIKLEKEETARKEREAERERREERERKERKEELERKIAEAEAKAEREREREREFYKRLSEIQQSQRDPLATMSKVVEQLAPLKEMFGLKGPGEQDDTPKEPKGLAEVVGDLVSTYINSQVKMTEIQAKMAQGALDDDEEEVDENGIPLTGANPAQAQIAGPTQAQGNPAAAVGHPPGGAPAPQAPAGGIPEDSQDLSIRVAARARHTGLDAASLKRARQAIKVMVQTVRSTPESERLTVVMGTLQAEPLAGAYMKVVGIRTALLEAGLSADDAAKVVAVADSTGMLQPDVRRD